MPAVDEITELSIKKKNGSIIMELKFSCDGGAERNLVIKDDMESGTGGEKTQFVQGHDSDPAEAESDRLLYKYTYPLRDYLVDLFGWNKHGGLGENQGS